MMEEKDYKEVKEIFNRFFNKSIINLEDAEKLAKIIIKNEIGAGLPNGSYYVNEIEVTMDNIDSFAYPQLAQANLDHIDMFRSDLKS